MEVLLQQQRISDNTGVQIVTASETDIERPPQKKMHLLRKLLGKDFEL